MVTGDDGVASVKVTLRASPFPLNFFLPLVGLVHAIALVHLRPPPTHSPQPFFPHDLDARLTKRGSSCYGDNHDTISIKEIELTSPHVRSIRADGTFHQYCRCTARAHCRPRLAPHRAILNIRETLFCAALICPADE